MRGTLQQKRNTRYKHKKTSETHTTRIRNGPLETRLARTKFHLLPYLPISMGLTTARMANVDPSVLQIVCISSGRRRRHVYTVYACGLTEHTLSAPHRCRHQMWQGTHAENTYTHSYTHQNAVLKCEKFSEYYVFCLTYAADRASITWKHIG